MELHKTFDGAYSRTGTWKHDDEILTKAFNDIGKFEANFGGTSLDEPIIAARKLAEEKFAKKTHIFILTDGQVLERQTVYDELKNLPEFITVSTLGIGRSFDEELVRVIAEKGRGSASRIYDLQQGDLSAAAASPPWFECAG